MSFFIFQLGVRSGAFFAVGRDVVSLTNMALMAFVKPPLISLNVLPTILGVTKEGHRGALSNFLKT